MIDLYPLSSNKENINLVWRESETPDPDTGTYTTIYGSAPLKAVPLPVANTLRVGVQNTGQIYMHGAYYDQQRRQFLLDGDHPQLADKNWIIFSGKRYEIESVERGPGDVVRVTGRQETGVAATNYIIEEVRSTLFIGETLDD